MAFYLLTKRQLSASAKKQIGSLHGSQCLFPVHPGNGFLMSVRVFRESGVPLPEFAKACEKSVKSSTYAVNDALGLRRSFELEGSTGMAELNGRERVIAS
jgi:hypothetical protein